MSQELSETTPFVGAQKRASYDRAELNLLHIDSSKKVEDVQKRISRYLDLLNLNTESTVEEVRESARNLRNKFKTDGLDQETVRALRWALYKADEIGDTQGFLWFLLDR